MTITEFLLSRIEEDEDHAKRAAFGWGAEWQVVPENDEEWSSIDAEGKEGVVGSEDADVIVHIGTHDPSRVLAECAAKRAILEQHKDWPVLVEKKAEFSEEATDIRSMAIRVSQEMAWLTEREYVKRFGTEAPTTNMVKALAAVYASHPDYRQEWAL